MGAGAGGWGGWGLGLGLQKWRGRAAEIAAPCGSGHGQQAVWPQPKMAGGPIIGMMLQAWVIINPDAAVQKRGQLPCTDS